MADFVKNVFGSPTLRDIRLKNCSVDLSLDRLKTGVDNVRHDVYISAEFSKTVRNVVLRVIARQTGAEDVLSLDETSGLIRERDRFKRYCREIMLDAVNNAKLVRERQIDVLAQMAIVKLLLAETQKQYAILSERFRNTIRAYELAGDHEEAIALKKRMATVIDEKETFLRAIGNELFSYLREVQAQTLNEMRRINFGEKTILPDDLFANPMLYVENPSDDFFIIKEYEILLGHRLEDADRYSVLVSMIRSLLTEIRTRDIERLSEADAEQELSDTRSARSVDGWLMEVDNVDLLFNCFQTKHEYRALRQKKGDRKTLSGLRKKVRGQKQRLNFFYKKLRKAKILKRLVAVYEMQPVYLEYCPPLVPQIILQFFISRRAKKSVISRLKRLNRIYGNKFALGPLKKKRRKLWLLLPRNKKAYLIRFFKDFFRYHRDSQNYRLTRKVLEAVHLLTEEKLIHLSRANNTLYEFLLPHEHVDEKKPIISHVIIKADVRGSTDITHRMLERGLNPATYFSLNFFDPITEILSDYGASKVFVEGDAIILSIFEREETPDGWYSVARACGLATKILSIVRGCNLNNRKSRLPPIELGIGITYYEGSPTFLFDGDNRIMISFAINLADRLSGCSKDLRKKKALRQKMSDNQSPFNLYVYQTVTDEDMAKTADDLFLRYNVNGIQLNAEGFEKLSKEIGLKTLRLSARCFENGKAKFYVGKFPLVSGDYECLIVREARIPKVNPDTLDVSALTDQVYYEVCSDRKLCKQIEKLCERR